MTGTEAVNNNVIVVKPNTNTNTNADNAIKKDTNKSSSIWTTQVQQAVEQAKKSGTTPTVIVVMPGKDTNSTNTTTANEERLTPEEQVQRSKNIMDFFKGCDSKDKDGEKDNVITKQELYEAVKNKNPKAKIDDLAKQNEFFEKYDKNKDGELDFDEFSAMCKDKDYVYLAKKLKVNLHSENGVNMPSDDKEKTDPTLLDKYDFYSKKPKMHLLPDKIDIPDKYKSISCLYKTNNDKIKNANNALANSLEKNPYTIEHGIEQRIETIKSDIEKEKRDINNKTRGPRK